MIAMIVGFVISLVALILGLVFGILGLLFVFPVGALVIIGISVVFVIGIITAVLFPIREYNRRTWWF